MRCCLGKKVVQDLISGGLHCLWGRVNPVSYTHLASIERAQQAIETEAAALTGGQSVSDACAALDAQILTLTVQVQQKRCV